MRNLFTGFVVTTFMVTAPFSAQAKDYVVVQDPRSPQVITQNPALLPSSTSAATSAGMPGSTYRLQRVDIIDPSGFGRPMTAVTVLVPAGWKPQGGIDWAINVSGCGKKTPHFDWRATSPDGQSAMEILAEENWSGNNQQTEGQSQQGCPNIQITSAREYINTWVQYNRPGARVLDYRDRADFVAELEKQLQPLPAMPGSESRQWAEGGQALIGYNHQGTEMRELIGIAILFNLFRMQGVMPGEVSEYLSISTLPGFAMRAPDGQLDFKLAEMLRKSGRPNPQWLAKLAQHNNKMTQINNKGVMDRSRIMTKTNNEIRAMQRDSWNKYNASQDYLQRETTEAIRGTETYNDPSSGGTVELDNTYENAWQLDDGSYVVTDDPSFNPYETTGQGGQQLEVTP